MLAISDGMTSTVQDNYTKSHAIGRESPWDEAELWQPARENGGKFHTFCVEGIRELLL